GCVSRCVGTREPACAKPALRISTKRSRPRRPRPPRTRRWKRPGRWISWRSGTSRKSPRRCVPSAAPRPRVGSSARNAARPSARRRSVPSVAPRAMARPSSVRSAVSRTGTDVADDTRRAGLAYSLAGTAGTAGTDRTGVQAGRAEAVIGDDGLSVGPVALSFLDADALRAANYRIEIDCWPAGRLTLDQLGRRFDTFLLELSRARNRARVRCVLAHGVTMPVTFTGALLDATVRPADFQIYDTHVTVVPADADPYQIPMGALTDVTAQQDPPAVLLAADSTRTVVGHLARHRDAFLRAVTERRQTQAGVLAELTGLSCFADGLAVPRAEVAGFDDLV